MKTSTAPSSSSASSSPRGGLLHRIVRFMTQPSQKRMDDSLGQLRNSLGINPDTTSDNKEAATTQTPLDDATQHQAATEVTVYETSSISRPTFYAPDMDGQPEPGEVVWIWAPTKGPHNPPKKRAMVVVDRTRSTLLGLIISVNPERGNAAEWIDIGAGGWDERGRQSWVRLDRILEVSELDIRRQGTVMPRGRFERIASRLRNDYGWT